MGGCDSDSASKDGRDEGVSAQSFCSFFFCFEKRFYGKKCSESINGHV
ncbi:hypothetical protein AB3S75_042304 [Citrus x aurantiifolia]